MITELLNAYFEVVAPPIRTGILMPTLSNSLTLKIISSKEGVMRPDIPTKSAIRLEKSSVKCIEVKFTHALLIMVSRRRIYMTSPMIAANKETLTQIGIW